MSDRFWRSSPSGVTLTLRVTPNGGVDRIDGPERRDDGSEVLRVRVKAVPEDGKANAAVIALLGKSLSLPKSAMTVVSGETARTKTVRVKGDPAALLEVLAKLG